ncbi:MAG: flagellin lysine-N-methylase [Sarcina sp.]
MKKDIIQYNGYNDFKCITDKCRHTCCIGWQIDIDDETYNKYKGSTYFKNDMSLKFTQKKDKLTSMKLDKDKKCGFLQEDFLCKIHLNIGEDFLCDTCRIYPRGINIVGDKVEKHIYSSCQAMIEMFLLNDRKLTFELEEGNYNEKEVSKVIEFETDIEESIFTQIRGFTIEVIQSDYINIEEKFTLMGLAYSNFDEFMKEKNFDAIRNVIEIYSEMIEDETAIPKLESTQMFNEVKKVVLNEISNFNLKGKLKELLPNLSKVLSNAINYEDKKFDEKYNLYKSKHDIHIQNYLVNIVYSTGMPLVGESTLDSYILLIIKYIVFKTYLTSVKNEEITKDDFIDIVALSSRSFDHNKKAVDMLIKELKVLASISDDMIGVLVNLIK